MLARIQEMIARALTSEDARIALREELDRAADLSDDERQCLEGLCQDDGLRLTNLLVRKLRFEQLVMARPELLERFNEDIEGFMRMYEQYVASVPQNVFLPSQEAEHFKAWLARLS